MGNMVKKENDKSLYMDKTRNIKRPIWKRMKLLKPKRLHDLNIVPKS